MRMLVSQPPLPCRSADQRSKSNILRLLKGPIAGPKPSKPRPECPDVFSTRVPEAFNTHRQDGRGSGLVQDVLRSPARIPAAESRRRGLCAAPANVKRCTFLSKQRAQNRYPRNYCSGKCLSHSVPCYGVWCMVISTTLQNIRQWVMFLRGSISHGNKSFLLTT
jgi:hypothetical protein